MRKRLIIELEDDAFRSVLGALLKVNADFRVESISQELPPARTLQRTTSDGKSSRDIFLDALTTQSANGRVSRATMRNIFMENGFAATTIYGVANALASDGLIVKDGDDYIASKGTKATYIAQA